MSGSTPSSQGHTVTYNFPPTSSISGGGGGGGGGGGAPRILTTSQGLNVHANAFQGSSGFTAAGGGVPPSMLHHPAHSRPHSRKYDSEPLRRGDAAIPAMQSDRYNMPGSAMHGNTASYLSTSTSSQASSRSQSRTSSFSSHMPSPATMGGSHQTSRAHSPHSHTQMSNYSSPGANNHNQQNNQSQQLMPPPALSSQQGQGISPPLSTRSSGLTSPPVSSMMSTASQSTAGSSPSTPATPSTTPCCASCLAVAHENSQLRSTVVTQSYELRQLQNAYKMEVNKMRGDVTKALIAFENRLHLQLQQQLGFKPDLEPMNISQANQIVAQQAQQSNGNMNSSTIVAQALSQIQQTLDKFDPSRLHAQQQQHQQQQAQQQQQQQQQSSPQLLSPPDDSAWGSKRHSWNSQQGGLLPAPQSNSPAGGWAEQSNNGGSSNPSNSPYNTNVVTSPGSLLPSHHSNPPLGATASPSALLANLGNLGQINLQSLSQLLNAVNGIQNQLNSQQGGPPQHHHSVSPQMGMQHHGLHSHHLHGGGAGSMTEERLILLAIDILSVHGAVPVGKMGCEAFGTQIALANGCAASIEDVQVGDELVGTDGRIVRVTGARHAETDLLYKITAKEGAPLLVTAEHRVTVRWGGNSGDNKAVQLGAVSDLPADELFDLLNNGGASAYLMFAPLPKSAGLSPLPAQLLANATNLEAVSAEGQGLISAEVLSLLAFESAHLLTGVGMERQVQLGDACRIVCMLSNPVNAETSFLNAQDERAHTMRQLDSALLSLGVRPTEASGLVVTEIVSDSTMRAALETGASVIVAFGDEAISRWSTWGATHGCVHHEDASSLHFEHNGRVVTIVKSVHPSISARFAEVVLALRTAVEQAYHCALPQLSEAMVASWPLMSPITSIELVHGCACYASLEVDGSDHRYVHADGVVTHNSLLHKAANDHTLPQMLKERYGGLKKFLQSQTHFFSLGVDHPYNPSLSLSQEFLAANPHIRPPEPASAASSGPSASPSPGPIELNGMMSSSLSSTSTSTSIGSTQAGAVLPVPDHPYHQYFSGSTTPGNATPSLLTPPEPTRSMPATGSVPAQSSLLVEATHSARDRSFSYDPDSEHGGDRHPHFHGMLTSGPVSLGERERSAGTIAAVGSAGSVLSLTAAQELAWDSHSSPDLKSIGAPKSASSSTDEPLQVNNSPALGATAQSDLNFFSSLLE